MAQVCEYVMANSKVLLPAFQIDGRVTIKIELELANMLGRLILETDTKNTALLALGHQLRSLCDVAGPVEPADLEDEHII